MCWGVYVLFQEPPTQGPCPGPGQVWRPAYFDPRDRLGRDVCTYKPKPWYEPYVTVVPISSTIVDSVCLTQAETISVIDLRRLSVSNRTPWTYNKHGTEPQTLHVGTWVLRDFGARGKYVGRVTRITEQTDADGSGDEDVYHVEYEDANNEAMTPAAARRAMENFDSSGFKLTTGWTSPQAGIRQLQRMDRALARRHKRNQRRARRAAVTSAGVENPGDRLMTDGSPVTAPRHGPGPP